MPAELTPALPAAPALPPARPGATSLDRSRESTLTALYRAALGPVHADYYLPVFERFEAAGRAGPSWNRAACLCTFNWMVFRQLRGTALVYAATLTGVALLLWSLGHPVFQVSDTARLCLLVAFGLLAFMVPGIWGNALLYQHIRNTMKRAVQSTATVPEACVLLNRQASSRPRMVWIALANAVVVGAGVGTYIAWPQTSHGLRAASAARAPVPTASQAPRVDAPAPAAAPVAASAPAAAPSAAATAMPASPVAVAPVPPASSASMADKRFFINVGLFAEEGNARRALTKLIDAGLPAFAQELDAPRGKRTRVRAGPFDTQAEAEAAAGRIRTLQLEAVVFRQ